MRGEELRTIQLEQIGVGSGAVEDNGFRRRVNAVNQYPVTLNMTFGFSHPVTMQPMVPAAGRQGLFRCYKIDNFPQFSHVFAAALHCLGVFL